MTETMTTSETGGQKGTKPVRHGLLDALFMNELALHAGLGAEKYSDDNWRKGYPLSLSFDAMQRHAWAWQSGESRDPEMGTHHMAAVAFHAMVIFVNELGIEFGDLPADFDTRPNVLRSLQRATELVVDVDPREIMYDTPAPSPIQDEIQDWVDTTLYTEAIDAIGKRRASGRRTGH